VNEGDTSTLQVMTSCIEESESWMLNSWYPNKYFSQHIEAEDAEQHSYHLGAPLIAQGVPIRSVPPMQDESERPLC
jgi:hypothetical protein